jgi:hypothetical protein
MNKQNNPFFIRFVFPANKLRLPECHGRKNPIPHPRLPRPGWSRVPRVALRKLASRTMMMPQ